MTQIKVFNGLGADEINKWLTINKDIEVIDIKRREVIEYHGNGEYAYSWTETMIIYKEEAE